MKVKYTWAGNLKSYCHPTDLRSNGEETATSIDQYWPQPWENHLMETGDLQEGGLENTVQHWDWERKIQRNKYFNLCFLLPFELTPAYSH